MGSWDWHGGMLSLLAPKDRITVFGTYMTHNLETVSSMYLPIKTLHKQNIALLIIISYYLEQTLTEKLFPP